MTKDEAIAVRPGMMVQFRHGLKRPALVIDSQMIADELIVDAPPGTADVYLTVLRSDGTVLKNIHYTWFDCAIG